MTTANAIAALSSGLSSARAAETNPMAGFIQGSQLASQQMGDARAAEKQKAEMLTQNLQMIGSIALGAKGGRMDGPVDPAKFEQGLEFLASRGVNVDQFRGRPEMADVAASSSMTAMQQLQAGMLSNQVQQQFLQNLLRVRADERATALSERQARAAETAAARAGVPAGYEPDPTTPGRVRPIAGGPQDPSVPGNQSQGTPQSTLGKLNADLAAGRITREQFDVEQERITKAAENPLPQNIITSLNSTGKTLTDASRFARTFQDGFAGYGLAAVGNAANTLARAGVGTANMERGAAWWQDYDRYKNQVRNELFGSALTATEQAAFERADIQPGMSPAQIRKNLDAQKQAALDAAKKLVAPHVLAGKSVEQIEAAVGFSLSDLGIARPARRERPQPPSASPAASAPAPAQSPPAASAAAPAARRKPGDIIGPAPGEPEGRTGRLRDDGTRFVVRNGQMVVVE